MKERTEYIKVNLPASEKDFLDGNGEGCFVLVDKPTKALWENDENIGNVCHGTLDNDSWYYPEMKHGTEIKFELRGDKRPVAIIEKYAKE